MISILDLVDQIVVRMNVNPIRYRSLYESLTRILESYNVKMMTSVEVMEQLIKIAHQLKKQVAAGKDIKLSAQELAFYDLLTTKEKYFENFKRIQDIAREIVKVLGSYTTVADFNRKEFLRAKIRAIVKNLLIKDIDGRATYNEIEQLSLDVVSHAETMCLLQSDMTEA